ncbi:hypothetical protein NDU88_007038 [Pleurodeles waltl]|uniref:Uncharacterized protein n=1 Tax=Pleurodeles waltl TaxID=8319 RepID=A0AAV7UMR1_PLEWA|nr:hypothetical protein NDU88_007038 [Pleurodeles waltl]
MEGSDPEALQAGRLSRASPLAPMPIRLSCWGAGKRPGFLKGAPPGARRFRFGRFLSVSGQRGPGRIAPSNLLLACPAVLVRCIEGL